MDQVQTYFSSPSLSVPTHTAFQPPPLSLSRTRSPPLPQLTALHCALSALALE